MAECTGVAAVDGTRRGLEAGRRLAAGSGGRRLLRLAGGLVWLRVEGEPEADLVRALVRRLGGGYATLVRARPAIRASVPVFEPQPAPLAALSARLKAQFDPKGIFNPGRMAPG